MEITVRAGVEKCGGGVVREDMALFLGIRKGWWRGGNVASSEGRDGACEGGNVWCNGVDGMTARGFGCWGVGVKRLH